MLYADRVRKAGLDDRHVKMLQRTLLAFPEVEKLVLYGSRAKGRFAPSSDVDLAIYGLAVTDRISAQFKGVLFDGLPFYRFVDVVAPAHLPNPRLVEEIEKHGVVIYEKDPGPQAP